jgi:two-component system sensor histidine kinase KdpD
VSRRADPDHLSIVIHELRNPLVGIDAAARVLARELGAHPSSQRASAIASEARHLLGLLESVADAEAVEAGRLRSTPRAIDLASLVRETVAAMHVADHPVTVSTADVAVTVDADEGRIRQVLTNLLRNAAQYSPRGAPIEVTLTTDGAGRTATVEIRDHGPGIPERDRRRLFQKFVRLVTADGTRGSGLGLFICRAIVEEHGGTIRFARPSGGGSSFVVELPLKRSARPRAAATQVRRKILARKR